MIYSGHELLEAHMTEEYLTPEEVAARYKVTRQAIYKWISEGKLRAIKLGRTTRIPATALQEFIKPADVEQPKQESEENK